MTILVYADKKNPEDSIGQRDDGAVTCLYGQSPDDWRDGAEDFVWVTGAMASAFMMDAGPLLFTITEA